MKSLLLILILGLGCNSKPEIKPTYRQAEKLFEQQKFIESAGLLSKLLDADPRMPGARNLLARCFFFLGNPDRSVEELQFVLANSAPASEENLDALFLLGAVALEAPNVSEKSQKIGLHAWELYLKVAPKSPLHEKVVTGLSELKAFENPQKATDLARAYVKNSQASKALTIFARVLKKHPSYVPALHYQGMAFIMSGQPALAVRSWRLVMEKDPAYAKKFNLDKRIQVAQQL
ncbi:MAG: tetratricopeptide repeat protein [Myxococcota bacterium]